jgi:hypothetical protein
MIDGVVNKHLNESSLSRLWKHNEEHDCGAMTAFRVAPDCGNGEHYTKKEKRQRNKSLRAKLKSKGYGVTELKGKYPEGGTTVMEESYFIVDLKDTGNLEKDLVTFGKLFEQDSVLFVPKGAIQNKVKAFLIGTNNCPDALGMGKKLVFDKGKLGHESKIYTSFVNGRPFIFESVCREIGTPGSGMGWWAVHVLANKPWQEMEIDMVD